MKNNYKKILTNAKKVFKEGSITYFNSSQFFPQDIRQDVSILYSFVRISDDFVDSIPQQKDKFYDFKNTYQKALTEKVDNETISSFVELMQKKNIDPLLPNAFLKAMEQDLTKSTYQTIEELEEYMYGSANVIGLMMAKILSLPEKSYPYAEMLGKSMQFINFIRDINHDLSLKRNYIPKNILNKYALESLEYDYTSTRPEEFKALIQELISIYYSWQREAEKGFEFIEKEHLIPIKTASDIYLWTADQIYKDPFIVYKKRLKPEKIMILETLRKNQKLLQSKGGESI